MFCRKCVFFGKSIFVLKDAYFFSEDACFLRKMRTFDGKYDVMQILKMEGGTTFSGYLSPVSGVVQNVGGGHLIPGVIIPRMLTDTRKFSELIQMV